MRIASRRMLLWVFQIPTLIYVPLLFWWVSGALMQADTLQMIKVGIFVADLVTVAQFSFWGNYIPLVFPTHLGGTGESFATNIGGRVVGTAAAWFTITLSESRPPDQAKIALVGAGVTGRLCLDGFDSVPVAARTQERITGGIELRVNMARTAAAIERVW